MKNHVNTINKNVETVLGSVQNSLTQVSVFQTTVLINVKLIQPHNILIFYISKMYQQQLKER